MKEYVYENVLNSNIKIVIKANNKEDAEDMLYYSVINESDYKIINHEQQK